MSLKEGMSSEGTTSTAKLYTSLDQLSPLHWSFLDECSQSFTTTAAWYRLFAELQPQVGARCYFSEDSAGRPQAALLLRSPAEREGSLLSRRWLGRRSLGSLTSCLSVIFQPHLRRELGDKAGALTELATMIRAERPAWSPIILGVMPRSELFDLTLRAFREAGFVARPYHYHNLWRLDTRGLSFNDFMAGRSKSLRKDLPRKLRKIKAAFRLRFELTRSIDEGFERALADYQRVFASSWKPAEEVPRFIEALCRLCAASGDLRLLVLYLDDQPAAARITILHKGVAHFVRTAYDERYRSWSLGSLLYQEGIRRLLDEDRVACLNFSYGNEPHKKLWLGHSEELWSVAAFNPRSAVGALSLGRQLLSETKRRLERWAKPTLKPLVVKAKRRLGFNPSSGRPWSLWRGLKRSKDELDR